MVFYLPIIIGIICISVFFLSNKELCCPGLLFSFPFFLMAVIACFNITKWDLEALQANTLVVIVLGIVCFILGNQVQKKFKISGNNKKVYESTNINDNITIMHLLLSIAVETATFLIYAYSLLRWGAQHGVSTLSDAINLSMLRGKFTSGNALDLSFFANSLIICSISFGYIYCTVLAKNIVYKRKGHNFLLALNIFGAICITLLSGSRGSSLELIVALAISIQFYHLKKNNWSAFFKAKNIFLGILVTLTVAFLFFEIKGLIGRGKFDLENLFDEFSVYMGAQEKNLDISLSKNTIQSHLFGYATLENIYKILNSYLGLNIYDNIKILSFNQVNGYNIGNVYTCFYNYFIDFKFIGVAIFSFISGVLSQYVYRKAQKQSYRPIDLWLVIYAYISACLIFCFFGNRFYDNLFSAGFIRMVIWINIENYYLSKIRLRRFNFER